MAKSDGVPHNVLVVRFSALGDVAMVIPVLYPICHAYPDTRFVMVTKPGPAGLFLDCPSNLEVVAADVTQHYRGARGIWRLAQQLRQRYHIDAVADLHSVMRSWMLDTWARLHGLPVARIDKQRRLRQAIINHQPDTELTPTIERYRIVLRQLGFSTHTTFTRLYEGKPLPTSAIIPPKEVGQRWIAISPFSAHAGKNYPLALMEQTIDLLAQQPNVSIWLLGGGKTEKTALRPFAKRHANVLSMAEVKHTFADEYALLGQCDVMVTMDSANMHLASLMGLRAVTVWGATSPKCGFMGYGQNPSDAVQLDLDCRPCAIYGEKPCKHGDYRCLTGITPQTIAHKVLAIIEHQS